MDTARDRAVRELMAVFDRLAWSRDVRHDDLASFVDALIDAACDQVAAQQLQRVREGLAAERELDALLPAEAGR